MFHIFEELMFKFATMKVVHQILIVIGIISIASSESYADQKDMDILDSLLVEMHTVSSSKLKIEMLIEASAKALLLNMYDDALKYSEEALDLAVSEKYKKEQAQAMVKMANAYRKLNDNKSAFEFASKAKELAEINSFDLEYSNASLLLSKIFFEIGEYDESLKLSYNSLSEFEKAHDYKELCDALNMIGITYIENQNDSLAEKYLTEAVSISKTHNLYSELGTAIGNLATLNGRNNKHLIAIDIQKQGCEVLNKFIKKSPNLGIGYHNIAYGYLQLNEPDSAYIYLMKALEVSQNANNFRNLSVVHMGLATYFKYIGDEKNFLKQGYLAFNISAKNDFKFVKLNMAEMLETYYLKQNNMDSAYKFKNAQFQLNKEINSQNISTKLAQFEILKEFELSEKERVFKQHQKTLYIVIVIITLVALLVLLLVLLLRYRLKVSYSILKQEKLEDEIYYKNKESTVSLMELMKKNELLADVTLELIKVSKKSQNDEIKRSISNIAVKIENITKEKIWEEFSARFQQVHANFYKKLGEQYPDLTPNEQRLCAFLKLNLSTKEISSMTGQSERAIIMARHRLRKKMGIHSQDVNLVSFFSNF
jgi:tetratricopeptide (TPR) repeat protein